MLVETNSRGKTHEEHAGADGCWTCPPCTESDLAFGNYCVNCGWRLDHVQERGAEIVVHWHHQDWE